MAYFVTGATGFIGRHLVEKLLPRGKPIYVLVRRASQRKLDAMREEWGADDKQVIAVTGDLDQAESRRRGRGPAQAEGQGRPPVPSRGGLRPVGVGGSAAARERRRHAQRRRLRGERPGRRLPPRELDRRRGPLRRRVPRGHVRGGRGPRSSVLPAPSTSPKAVVRRECKRPFRIYRPGLRRRPQQDRLHRQDRRPVLLLQGDPEDAADAAAVDADDRHRGRAHQHRAGRLRRGRARPHRAQEGARRQDVPPDRSRAAPHRRSAQHLRRGRARAAS